MQLVQSVRNYVIKNIDKFDNDSSIEQIAYSYQELEIEDNELFDILSTHVIKVNIIYSLTFIS